LAQELGFVQVSPTIIFEDNNGAIAIDNSGHFKGRSKHIDLCFFFLSDYISRGLIKFERVDTKNQIADIGTAPRPWPVLQRHRSILYGETSTSSSTQPQGYWSLVFRSCFCKCYMLKKTDDFILLDLFISEFFQT
jgi:hypothetical protein